MTFKNLIFGNFWGPEVVGSSLYQKILLQNLLIYIGLHCVRRSLWIATTLATLTFLHSMYLSFCICWLESTLNRLYPVINSDYVDCAKILCTSIWYTALYSHLYSEYIHTVRTVKDVSQNITEGSPQKSPMGAWGFLGYYSERFEFTCGFIYIIVL